ncbi:hypothetical protein U1Q18_030021 [Sarracenia purpurea var. burkii]
MKNQNRELKKTSEEGSVRGVGDESDLRKRAIALVDDISKHNVDSPFELGSPPAVSKAEEDGVRGVGDESDLCKRAIAPDDDRSKHDVNSPFEHGSPPGRWARIGK